MSRRNFVLRNLALAALVVCGSSALASPAIDPEARPQPLEAVLVFSRLPDAEGRFEVELYLEAREALTDLALEASLFGPAKLQQPTIEAPPTLAAGTSFAWRTLGRFKPGAPGIPPGLRVEIRARLGTGGDELVILEALPLTPVRRR